MALLALALASALQAPDLALHPGDPLHRFVELEVGAEGAGVEHVADFQGTLHVWARSEAFDAKLRIEVAGRVEPLQDEDSGGGTAAWLAFEVAPGDAVSVLVSPSSGAGGSAELHLVAAPETEETRAAARAAGGELEAIRELQQRGDLGEARRRVSDLVRALRAAEGSECSEAIAEMLRSVGFVAYRLAALEPAALAFGTAHEHRERLSPPDHPDLLAAKQALAWARRDLGDLAGAHELYEAVHTARARLLPPEHPDLLAAKSTLAWTRRMLGDPLGALELVEAVHATRERLLPPEHPQLLEIKHNLGWTRYSLGDFQRALELHEHVHAARERLLPPDHPARLNTKLALASTRYALGDLAGALALQEVVHAARTRLLPHDHPDLLYAKQNLALTRWELGDLAGARELAKVVHAEYERVFPPDHRNVIVAKLNLILMREQLGDRAGARELTRSLLDAQLAVASRLRFESPRVARAAAGGELRRLARVLSLTSSDAVEEDEELDKIQSRLFAVLESLRSVSISSPEVALAVASHPELGELRDRLARARARLSDRVAAAPDESDAGEDWHGEVVELADERDRLERGLRAALAGLGLVLEGMSAEAVARGLGEGAALASFFRYRRSFDRIPEGETPRAVDSLLAFVVTPDARVRRVELGPAAPLEGLVQRWRAGIGKPVQARGVGVGETKPEDPRAGLELRAALLDPCLAQLEERPTTLHVVLDDFLHSIPLGALPGENGGVLQDELDLRLSITVARLVSPARSPGEGDSLLALGGIDFDAEAAQPATNLLAAASPPIRRQGERAGPPGRLLPLPESDVEVEGLAALHELLVGGKRVVLTQGAATKQALFEHAPQARFLHLATHGWFAADDVASTNDVHDPRDGLTLVFARAEGTVQAFAPETLCGLALAGANRGVDELGRMPGIATAEEIAALDLSGCELAVLSACETNVGLRHAGQGIQSLQTALHAAGARTAITSLWKVDDAATRRLFELFYKGLWGEGQGKAEALQRAQKRLREAGHPLSDWAAWVLSGDPF